MTWRTEKILIIGKTYPSPSRQQLETVCTGGISESGEWRRLYPVRFRYLGDEQKFKDWQWIEVDAVLLRWRWEHCATSSDTEWSPFRSVVVEMALDSLSSCAP